MIVPEDRRSFCRQALPHRSFESLILFFVIPRAATGRPQLATASFCGARDLLFSEPQEWQIAQADSGLSVWYKSRGGLRDAKF